MTPDQHIDKKIFVGGLMRSGTSLLKKMIGQHSLISSTFETHWMTEDFYIAWASGIGKRADLIKDFLSMDNTTFNSFRGNTSTQYEFLDVLMGYIAQRDNKVSWVEKTPENVFSYNLIMENWKDPFVIDIVRNPLDNYSSWKKKQLNQLGDNASNLGIERFKNDYLQAINEINFKIDSKYSKYLCITYEDLVCKTRETMMLVAEFLGIEDYSSILANIPSPDENEKIKSVLGRDSHTALQLSKTIFNTSVGRYKKELLESEIEYLECCLIRYYELLEKKIYC